jgi:hypothetical protein
MSKARHKRRAYSPRRARQDSGTAAKGAAAFSPLVETKLTAKQSGPKSGQRAVKLPKDQQAIPSVFSAEALEASRQADIRHRKARRNAKSRGGRLFFG